MHSSYCSANTLMYFHGTVMYLILASCILLGPSIISYRLKNQNIVWTWVDGWGHRASQHNGCSHFKIGWFQKHVFDHCNSNKIFLLKFSVIFVINCAIVLCLECPVGEEGFGIRSCALMFSRPTDFYCECSDFWVGRSPHILTLFGCLN